MKILLIKNNGEIIQKDTIESNVELYGNAFFNSKNSNEINLICFNIDNSSYQVWYKHNGKLIKRDINNKFNIHNSKEFHAAAFISPDKLIELFAKYALDSMDETDFETSIETYFNNEDFEDLTIEEKFHKVIINSIELFIYDYIEMDENNLMGFLNFLFINDERYISAMGMKYNLVNDGAFWISQIDNKPLEEKIVAKFLKVFHDDLWEMAGGDEMND